MYYYSNIIGSFVLNKELQIIDSLEFEDIEDYLHKYQFENKLQQKHKNLQPLPDYKERKMLVLFKEDQYMKKFYKHKEDLQEEKDSLDKIASEVQNKSTEKSLRELIYNNCISPKTRWSFLAMMAFNFWPPFAGLTYADSYMTEIFDKLVYDGFGYKLTFYSGFFVVAGNLCTLLIVERVNRVTLLCCAQLVITICMWLLAFCFYFN